jgi:hypothetical protein
MRNDVLILGGDVADGRDLAEGVCTILPPKRLKFTIGDFVDSRVASTSKSGNARRRDA